MKRMKNVDVLFLLISLLIIGGSCAENEKTLITEIDSSLVSDSIAYTGQKTLDSLATKKCLYLTIDDGPIRGSEYIDSIISSEKIKASLFFVGNHVSKSPLFLKYYNKFKKNSFVEIYNHSYSHANNRYSNFYKTPELVLEDFNKNQQELAITCKIGRLPGRNIWWIGEHKKNHQQSGGSSAELLGQNGYKIFGWDVEWNYNAKDCKPKQTIDELVEAIEEAYQKRTFTPNHVVLLIHNQMFAKVGEANDLGELITKLKENNFSFEYLSSYPES